ncbi:VWA domain-containing protein (plasmid) [Comamonas aquatica]|nr:VWA domain-containing protein [Comamonas aquatica]
MIEKPVIEALATLGTGIAPSFQWSADALSLKLSLDSLAINQLVLPAECEDNASLLGMAMGLNLTKAKTNRLDLPVKFLRRICVLSMQFGQSLAEISQLGKEHESKVIALLDYTLSKEDISKTKPSLQPILVAAICAVKTSQSSNANVLSACQRMLLLAGVNQQTINIVGNIMLAAAAAESTSDFSKIAEQFFPDYGDSCTDVDEINEGDGEKKAVGTKPSMPESQAQAEAQPDGQARAEAQPDGQAKAEAQPDGQAQAEAQPDGQAQAEAQPDGQAQAEAQPDGQVQAEAQPGGQAHAKAKSEGQLQQDDDALSLPSGDEIDVLNNVVENTMQILEQFEQSAELGSVVENKEKDAKRFAVHPNLVSEIMRLMQAADKRCTSLERQGQRVSPRHVWKLKKLGDTRIFKHTTKVVGSRVAVDILVDGSMSMHADLNLACEVSLAFCDALQRLPKASSALSVFSGNYGVSRVVKEYGEGVHQVRSKLGSLTASGNTPTGKALLQRMHALQTQTQDKKWLVVVTDGRASDQMIAVAAVEQAKRLGINVLGIGIGSHGNYIRQFLPDAICIKSIGEFQIALSNLIKTTAMA